MDASGHATTRDKKIPVRIWNQLVRNSSRVERDLLSTKDVSPEVQRARNVIWLQNGTSSEIPMFGAAMFGGVATDPTAGPSAVSSFASFPVLIAAPQEEDNPAFGIAVDPIPAGAIGRVAVGGAIPAKINVTDNDHEYAALSATAGELKSAESGPAVILWKESGVGSNKWAMIRLGGQGEPSHHLSKTSSAWSKSSSQTLTVYEGAPGSETPVTGKTVDAWNKFSDVATGKWVMVGRANGTWYLISAEC